MEYSDLDFWLYFLMIFVSDVAVSVCLSCSLSLSTNVCLSFRMCVPECPPGFFRDDKKRCKKCFPLCESCIGSRSDQCSTCRPGLYLVEGSNNCISSCPDGFYLDLGKLTEIFFSLQNLAWLLTEHEFLNLKLHLCCFFFTESIICRKCSNNCKKCISANICTECQPGLR